MQDPAQTSIESNQRGVLDDEIDLRRLFGVIKKWKSMIAGLTLLSLLTAAILSFFVLSPVYEARTTLLILQAGDVKQLGQQGKNGEGLEDVVAQASRIPELTLQSYVNQVKNETVAQRVIDKLGLQDRYSLFGLLGQIDATLIKDTNLLEVRVSEQDPLLAKEIANALAQEFVDYIASTNVEKLTKSGNLLDAQATEEEKNLQKAVEALNTFYGQPRNPNILEQESKNLLESLTKYRNAKMQAEIDIQQLQAQIKQMEQQMTQMPVTQTVRRVGTGADVGGFGGVTEVEEANPIYNSLRIDYSQKSAQLAGKQAELATTTAAIASIEGQWRQITEELANKQTEQERLKREVDRLSKTQTLLVDKVAQTRIAKSINQGETTVKIASPAVMPTSPVKPKKAMNMAISLVLGLIVSVGIAFVVEMLDNRIKNQDDVEQHLGIPVLGMIPGHDDEMLRGKGGKR
ncbi:GumC family protein [Heliophilum fasciatum]|uniref:Uncharacterized protein involved in exopolysaccharide biosynthesis n=1 Tax=Heliophilum fasciatum TaxID=35700 RepID=A0A4R2RW31_9FIRM|nr:GNVR domain-containing protein [Heliophilum fasciatum]MCW2278090.1 capsular polysaccharide biosynthesis protein [Heliophilum fasciatum]TCP64161.1 uncharacterized protein involved in exopolysaccharide biosynthesis [Heliophilum fasciatum]